MNSEDTRAASAFRSTAATHPGAVRTVNQDAFVNRPDLGLWAVADGAGGHESGEVASGEIVAALERLPAGLSAGEILVAVRTALERVHEKLRDRTFPGRVAAICASTVVVLVARDAHFACLWAGDSRAYLMSGGVLTRVTRDHSLVEELVEQGAITAEEADGHPQANVITRAVGADVEVLELEKRTGRFGQGDRFLLCSDGLTKSVAEGALASALAQEGAQTFIDAALAANCTDNVTALVVERRAL